MDNNQVEVTALKEVHPTTPEIVVLADTQLLFVGGGVGEITTH